MLSERLRRPPVVSGGAKVDHGSGGTVPLRRSKTLPLWEPFPVTGRGGGIHTVELYRKVRLACRDGMSERAAARHFGVSRQSVRKMLQFSVPPGYRRTAPVRRPKLDEFTGLIEQWLEDDRRHGYVDRVVIGCGTEVIARHSRSYEGEDSHAMASVRAHGPTPKARSTIRASPTMPPWRANISAGDEEWRTYARKAVTILEHTTEIAATTTSAAAPTLTDSELRLRIAAELGDVPTIDALIDAGVNPNASKLRRQHRASQRHIARAFERHPGATRRRDPMLETATGPPPSTLPSRSAIDSQPSNSALQALVQCSYRPPSIATCP